MTSSCISTLQLADNCLQLHGKHRTVRSRLLCSAKTPHPLPAGLLACCTSPAIVPSPSAVDRVGSAVHGAWCSFTVRGLDEGHVPVARRAQDHMAHPLQLGADRIYVVHLQCSPWCGRISDMRGSRSAGGPGACWSLGEAGYSRRLRCGRICGRPAGPSSRQLLPPSCASAQWWRRSRCRSRGRCW